MGQSHSHRRKRATYIGRGSTLEEACANLEANIQRWVDAKAFVTLSRPGEQELRLMPLSPRSAVTRYALLNVEGKGKPIALAQEESSVFTASIFI